MARPPEQTLKESHKFNTEEGAILLDTCVEPQGETTVMIDGKKLSGAQVARFAGALFRAGLYSGMPKQVDIDGESAGHPMLAYQALQSLTRDCINGFTEAVLYNVVADDGGIDGKYCLQWHLTAGTQSALLQPNGAGSYKISGAIPTFMLLKKQPASGLIDPASTNVRPIFGNGKG